MKLAIVTGVSRGLGFVIADNFAHAGWQVIGTGRSTKPAELTDAVKYEQFDASNTDACEVFWQTIARTHPNTEICLINNAGGYVSGKLTELHASDYAQQMQSCYFSAVYMTHALVRHIPKARIINIISSSALAIYEGDSAYGAAKTAERHFFQTIQQELAPAQYQITNVYPNHIASHGPDPEGISVEDLAMFIREQAELRKTFYVRDVTVYPSV